MQTDKDFKKKCDEKIKAIYRELLKEKPKTEQAKITVLNPDLNDRIGPATSGK